MTVCLLSKKNYSLQNPLLQEFQTFLIISSIVINKIPTDFRIPISFNISKSHFKTMSSVLKSN